MFDNFMQAVINGCSASEAHNFTWNHRVKLTLFENADNVSINYMRAMRPLARQGSLCLTWLTSLADEYHTPLAVPPTAQAPYLVKWYSQFDFKQQYNSVVMLRDPQAESTCTEKLNLLYI